MGYTNIAPGNIQVEVERFNRHFPHANEWMGTKTGEMLTVEISVGFHDHDHPSSYTVLISENRRRLPEYAGCQLVLQ